MEKLNQIFTSVSTIVMGETSFAQSLIKATLTLICAYFTWFILKRILLLLEKRTKSRQFFQKNDFIFTIFRRALCYGLILATGTFIVRLFNQLIIEKIFHAFIIILIASPAKEIFLVIIRYLEENVAQKTETKIDNVIFDIFNRFCSVIIYVTAIIMALDILGINIMPFVAGAGVAGIAIGFAAKDTLSNLIAGVLLIIDRPFEIGDRVEVWRAPSGSSTWGDVVDVGLRATKILTTDNIMVIIPNNEIMKRDIINYTLINSKIRVRINIGIGYNERIKKAKRIILQVAESAEWISKDPAPKVVVRNFGESSIELQLRVWIQDARERMNTISFITDRVKEEFDREGVVIPFPQRDIRIINKEEN